ncbi:PorT family protein [Gelidibacter salicanalis]|uniref:PorT family protein n=1 Tax=Gelidibacter salicanalis TaxID=291193 RepID=A0A5C7AKT6_9FLAO|nr:porin family protein [Gelidibacter salicanalis]TXE09011.1 PorT family protein [Gelidibacter salicanalis]
MKKIMIVAVIVVLSCSQYGHAQDINFGAKGGLNLANLNGAMDNRGNMVNFHVGVMTEFVFRRGLFGIQPELLYSRQGANSGSVYITSLDYISAPIMFKFFILEKLSLDIGPQTSFLIYDKHEHSEKPNFKKETGANPIDFGLNIGIGYNLDRYLFAHIRYNLGINTVYGDFKNSVVQFSLGYKL